MKFLAAFAFCDALRSNSTGIHLTQGFIDRQDNSVYLCDRVIIECTGKSSFDDEAMKEALTYLRQGRLKEKLWVFKGKLTLISCTNSQNAEKRKIAR